jgi:hypothetical protein
MLSLTKIIMYDIGLISTEVEYMADVDVKDASDKKISKRKQGKKEEGKLDITPVPQDHQDFEVIEGHLKQIDETLFRLLMETTHKGLLLTSNVLVGDDPNKLATRVNEFLDRIREAGGIPLPVQYNISVSLTGKKMVASINYYISPEGGK